MGFVQGNSGGTALGANVATYTLAFANAITQGNTIVVDLVWDDAVGSTPGDVSITDSAGNTYTKVFGPTELGSAGFYIEQYVAQNAGPGSGAISVTATYTPASGHAWVSAISMAIHEYSGLARSGALVSGYQDNWTTGTSNPVTESASVTTTAAASTSYLLHAFGASLFNPVYQAANLLPIPGPGPFWMQRETAGTTGIAANLVTFDLSQAVAGSAIFEAAVPNPSALTLNCAAAITAFVIPLSPASPGSAWLIINEPAAVNPTPGYTDRSALLSFSKKVKHTFTNTLQQRGTAEIPLFLKASNSYDPTQLKGCQVFLYDQPPSGPILVWAGKIMQVEMIAAGLQGNRIAKLQCVSFRQCFDSLLIPPQVFQSQTAGSVFTTLYGQLCGGVPINLGTVNGTFVIDYISFNWDRLTDAFDAIAKAAACVWDIDLPTLTVYFKPPSTTAAPYTVQPKQMLYGSVTFKFDLRDYRNRQILEIDSSAFAQSSETFVVSGYPSSYTLKAGAQSITGAWLTNSTNNTATGTFSGLPSPGDTATISYPQTGSIYNWAPDAPYSVGQAILDPNNHIQVVTVAGTSGSSQPSWNDTGGNTSDGPGANPVQGFTGAVVWKDQGLTGPGGIGANIYTFVEQLDNTQWGEVLIGATAAQCAQNLADAINCNQAVRGQTFSSATWENPLVNALQPGGAASFTIQGKPPGPGYLAALAYSSSAFSWSGSETSGGSEGATYILTVAQNGQSNTANVYYTPGANVAALASNPSNSNPSRLVIQYARADVNFIIVENSAGVLVRAAIENSNGKYQQKTTDTSITSNTQGLQYVQSILAAYDSVPSTWAFGAFPPGILPGQLLDVSIVAPAFLAALVNGTWFVQEVTAELIAQRYGGYMNQQTAPGGGHYRYTVTLIDEAQVQSWLAFWQQLASGGGGGSGIGLVANSGLSGSTSGTSGIPAGIQNMGASGTLTPALSPSVYTYQSGTSSSARVLTGNATIAAPTNVANGYTFAIQLFQDSTGGRAVIWNSFYKGVSEFQVDTTANTYCTLIFQVSADGTFAQLLGGAQNGAILT